MRLRREKTHKSWWARLLAQDKIRHGGGLVLVAQLKMRTFIMSTKSLLNHLKSMRYRMI